MVTVISTIAIVIALAAIFVNVFFIATLCYVRTRPSATIVDPNGCWKIVEK